MRGSKQSDRYLLADYLDIPLKEIDGEIPIYKNVHTAYVAHITSDIHTNPSPQMYLYPT